MGKSKGKGAVAMSVDSWRSDATTAHTMELALRLLSKGLLSFPVLLCSLDFGEFFL